MPSPPAVLGIPIDFVVRVDVAWRSGFPSPHLAHRAYGSGDDRDLQDRVLVWIVSRRCNIKYVSQSAFGARMGQSRMADCCGVYCGIRGPDYVAWMAPAAEGFLKRPQCERTAPFAGAKDGSWLLVSRRSEFIESLVRVGCVGRVPLHFIK